MLKEITTFEKIITLVMTAGIIGLFLFKNELPVKVANIIVISTIILLIINKTIRFWPFLDVSAKIYWLFLIVTVLGTAITGMIVKVNFDEYILIAAVVLFVVSANTKYKKIIAQLAEKQEQEI